jgi:hypothetical protein
VDDKLRILTAVKKTWGDKVTTIFARQGHYALDTNAIAHFPRADMAIDHIGELMDCDLAVRVRPVSDEQTLPEQFGVDLENSR